MSNTSGLFVNDKTTGTSSVSANGRGTVTSLTISIAGIGGSLVLLPLFLWLLVNRFILRRSPSGRALALFCVAVLMGPMLAGCPRTGANQFVFYMISPTKAVLIHEANTDATPGITILEQ